MCGEERTAIGSSRRTQWRIQPGDHVAQIEPASRYNDLLLDRVVEYLQTRDARLFPFTARFDDHQRRAFVRDLREGLGDVNDSGSARKTSATGFIASDRRLRQVIAEWQSARGEWPDGSFPADPVTALGSSTTEDSPPAALYLQHHDPGQPGSE
jgi:hypothetical protein